MNFWQKLKKPIICLAPMVDVTDPAFRRIIAKYGKPDVMWTEFVSADGLFLSPVREYCELLINGKINPKKFKERLSNGVGSTALIKDLLFTEKERSIVAQFFTSKPEMMEKAAKLAVKLGFDGIDINMGCPDKSIEKQNAGAKLMTNPKLAQEIILAAKKGAGDLPVSVKTRIGWNKNELETWLPELLKTNPAVITVHARTRKEQSLVPARWEHIKRAVEIRNELKSKTLIFGNGDITDTDDARRKCKETGCDGVMIGRAIFGNPFLFANLSHAERGRQIAHPDEASARRDKENSTKKKLDVLIEHSKLFEKLSPQKNFDIMKKHFKAYVNGWRGAKELRVELMKAKNSKEVKQIISQSQKVA